MNRVSAFAGFACLLTACGDPISHPGGRDSGPDAQPQLYHQHAYVKASNTRTEAQFGRRLAMSRDETTFVIAADHDASASQRIDGVQHDTSAPRSGAVYVFVESAGVWHQQAYVKSSNSEPGDFFGVSVAISADGNTLLVAAEGEDSASTGIDGIQSDNSSTNSGAVYAFRRDVSIWRQQAYVKASNADARDTFGASLAVSADGSTFAVGATGEASASSGVNGDEFDNSSRNAGAVYVFRREADQWLQEAYIKSANPRAGDLFGWNVALSGDGSVLAVSAVTEHGPDELPLSGAVHVFRRAGSGWELDAYVRAPNAGSGHAFGMAVALSDTGDLLAVGANGEASGIETNPADNSVRLAGAAYTFRNRDGTWEPDAYIKAPAISQDALFGTSVAIAADGGTLVVGAPGESAGSGNVYAFTRSEAQWRSAAVVRPRPVDAGDRFGTDVALGPTMLLVGAPGEDGASRGVYGDPRDNAAPGSGAGYVFVMEP
jgi:hypothetical protein